MGKALVLVESPTKAKTINKFLGDNFEVKPTMGHVIDLPQHQLGVSIKKGFVPFYKVVPNKRGVVSEIEGLAKESEKVFVATDPDREGEAIGWLLKEYLKAKGIDEAKFERVEFHEITPRAIRSAFSSPRGFDVNLVEAQKARRILDRIVGYYISPILWRKVSKGLSAGRVQSVALRMIVEREKEIREFVPKEYWTIEADFKNSSGSLLKEFRLSKMNNEKPEIENEKSAATLIERIRGKKFIVSRVEKRQKKKNPPPPFITSSMQQAAFNKLKFSAAKTMQIAQQLYEGIDLGQDASIGLITYMRTDSVNISAEAIDEVRGYIKDKIGQEFLPQSANKYKSKKGAQEAHEAIRPTSVYRTPDSVKSHLSKDQFALYKLIWERFIASQMKPAELEQISVVASDDRGEFEFRRTFIRTLFKGYTAIYEDNGDKDEKEDLAPLVEEGQGLDLIDVRASQHFTKPPSRYNDASLVRELEEKGIGRPSTYAPTIQTLIYRGYVVREKGALVPNELGEKIVDLLKEYFPEIMDYGFTAKMEDDLDKIEGGDTDSKALMESFYPEFVERVNFASKNMKKEVEETDEVCEKCGSKMVIRWGQNGKFLSCSNYPECKNTKSISTGVKCPKCGGELVPRRAGKGRRRGRLFYGCSNYPECEFTVSSLDKVSQGS